MLFYDIYDIIILEKSLVIDLKCLVDYKIVNNEENISKEAIDFLCWIDYKYWMDENRKIKIDQIKFDKIRKYEEERNYH